ncbi:MAG: hypothetical protein QME14_06270 [Methanobacteriaceae archaeon]|nr:hypothetical protein [Methanobacteriaceae archaeon]
MDMSNLNFLNDAQNDMILGKPIKIGERLIIPFIHIWRLDNEESLISSINPLAIFLSEQKKSTEHENYLFILSQKGSANESELIEFIESEKTTIFRDWGVDLNIKKLNIIYPFIDGKK